VGAAPLVTDVLVIDYDDECRTSTAEILRREGFSVVEADTAEVTLEALKRQSFRLLVLDPDLPFMSGIELVEHLPDPPPIVMVYAYPMSVADRERLGSKVLSYLRKPVPPLALIATVRASVG